MANTKSRTAYNIFITINKTDDKVQLWSSNFYNFRSIKQRLVPLDHVYHFAKVQLD
jgi:hypothetical protein